MPEGESNTIIRGFLDSLGEKSEEQPTKRKKGEERRGKQRKTGRDRRRSCFVVVGSRGEGEEKTESGRAGP